MGSLDATEQNIPLGCKEFHHGTPTDMQSDKIA